MPSAREYREIPIHRVRRAENGQIRQGFEETALAALAESIRRHGVKEPILVRPLPDGHFEIVAGERRWRAASAAGLETIPAIVEAMSPEGDDATERLLTQVAENVHRENLNPVDEAAALVAIVKATGWSVEEAGVEMGKGRKQAYNLQRVHLGPDSVKRRLREEKIEFRAAVELVGIHDALVRRDPKKAGVRFEKFLGRAEGWTVRRLAEYAKKLNQAGKSGGARPPARAEGSVDEPGVQLREPLFAQTANLFTIDLAALKSQDFTEAERAGLIRYLEGVLRYLRDAPLRRADS